MAREVPDFFYGELRSPDTYYPNRGPLTERRLKHVVACAEAMKSVLGDSIGLALDCGSGWTVPDAIRLARALEPLNLMWLEDLITGDYVPYVAADQYREVTRSTSCPTQTGEQIYLRQNFMDLIEKQAVRVIGPDPCDVGGIAELKWVAEYADLHGVLVAPHGIFDGLFGLAAHVQVAATLPDNFIAFEYGGPAGVVVRHRGWAPEPDRPRWIDRGGGPAWNGRGLQSRRRPSVFDGGGQRLLRLRGPCCD